METELSDGVVTLTPLALEDVGPLMTSEDELLVRWLNGGPATQESTEAHIRTSMEQWATGGSLRAFGVRAGADGVLAGTIDLRFEMPGLAPGQVNIAYGLFPGWRGRGLATRAVRLVCSYAGRQGAAQGVIQVDPDNLRSEAVARRAGFTYVEQVRRPEGMLFNWFVRDLP